MASKLFNLNLKGFPIKHLFLLILVGLLILLLFFTSYLELETENQKLDLKWTMEIEDLVNTETLINTFNYSFQEFEIKRNDSLYSILNKAGVYKNNIIEIINSRNSNLLSNIEVGDKIELTVNADNKVAVLKYIDNYKSGVEAILEDDKYLIRSYVAKIEKVKIYKEVIIEGSMFLLITSSFSKSHLDASQEALMTCLLSYFSKTPSQPKIMKS